MTAILPASSAAGVPAPTGAPRNPLAAGGWSGLSFALANALGALVYYPLARTLSPEDFGLYTEASLVYLGLVMLAEAAVVQALVQARGDIERLARAALWLATGLGLLGAMLCALAAPLMVRIYGDAELLPLLLLLAPGVFASGLGAVPHALLSRDLDFRRKTLPETLSIGLGGAAALGAALAGLGVYSLMVWSLGSAFVSTATAWWVVRRRPRFVLPDKASARQLAMTTVSIGAGDVALYVRLSTDYALTGRILGTEPLGVYSIAWGTSVGPLLVIQAFTGRVGFAVYSLLQAELHRLQRVFLSAVRIVAAAGMPVMLGAVIVAPDLVPVALGSKWNAAVGPLMILFVVQLLRTVGGQGASVMLALGRTRLYALIGLAAIPVTVLAILVGTRGGVLGVAWAMLAAVGGTSLVYLVVGMRLLRVRPRELLRTLAIPVLLTCAALPAIALTRALLLWGWEAPVLVRLIASILAGIVAAALLLRRQWPTLRTDLQLVRHAVAQPETPVTAPGS